VLVLLVPEGALTPGRGGGGGGGGGGGEGGGGGGHLVVLVRPLSLPPPPSAAGDLRELSHQVLARHILRSTLYLFM